MKSFRMSAVVFSLCLFSLCNAALAVDLTGQSRTYLLTRETEDSSRYTPLYEYLDFKAESANTGAVSFNFGGWYRYDLQNENSNSNRSGTDLQYAYLSIKTEKSNAAVNLGRIRVQEGAASEQIDGIYARTDLKGGFGMAVYGGSPVETNFDTRRGDTIYGGRIVQGVPGLYSLGISYLDERDDNKAFRKEDGVDLFLHPAGKLELVGMSSYNAITRNWMQHSYSLGIGPFGPVRLIGDFSNVSYQDYFTGSTLSAFSVPNINPDETITTTGGLVEYAVTSSLVLVADYKNLDYRIAGRADHYGGKLSYTGGSFGAGVNLHTMHGADEQLRYDEQGLYLYRKFSKADITLQGLHTSYKQEINGVKHAYSASVSTGYAVTTKSRAVADMEYQNNPEFKKDVRAMITFVYLFDAKFETKTNKAVSPKKK